MPNIADIMDVAQALEGSSVLPVQDRCVAVRNRHSTCRKCIDACLASAITVENNVLSLDSHACVGCGACTAVCPTEALVPLDPLDDDLAARAAAAMEATRGHAVFACARMAARNMGDPDKYVAVPCLGRMEESALLGVVAAGAGEVTLVDGTCRTCKYRAVVPCIDAAVSSANELLGAWGAGMRVRRASEFPEAALASDTRRSFGAARRGFFSQAGGMAMDAVKVAAEKAMEDALGPKQKNAPTLRERLGAAGTGSMPQFEARRRMNVLDALYEMGEPDAPEIATRLFGSVDIDAEKCNACNMCTVFCPTGALRKSDEAPEGGVGSYLEFSLADCVQCGLCADACMQKALVVSDAVSTEELFDFEPRLIFLPEPPERGSFLSQLKSRQARQAR